jgi:hypothetical protein
MSDDDRRLPALTPARLRAMAEWFREFAALASAEQRRWQLDLAAFYERLALERETLSETPRTNPAP